MAKLFLLIDLAVFVLVIAGIWKVFTKAGHPGWASLIPIYNLVVLMQIGGKPIWWIVLLLIPLVNLVVLILLGIGVAKNFGKSDVFGIGLALLGFIFFPILGFGSAQYQGSK